MDRSGLTAAVWVGQPLVIYALSDFKVDWDKQQAHCPAGKLSSKWEILKPTSSSRVIRVRFAKTEGFSCQVRPQCTNNQQLGRLLQLRPQVEHE